VSIPNKSNVGCVGYMMEMCMGKWRFCLRCQFCGFMDENHEKSSIFCCCCRGGGGGGGGPRLNLGEGKRKSLDAMRWQADNTRLIIIVVDQRERERDAQRERKKERVWQMRRILLLGESTKRVSRVRSFRKDAVCPGFRFHDSHVVCPFFATAIASTRNLVQ
jgi:hypothetical protein